MPATETVEPLLSDHTPKLGSDATVEAPTLMVPEVVPWPPATALTPTLLMPLSEIVPVFCALAVVPEASMPSFSNGEADAAPFTWIRPELMT
ncbi:hypothetical protein D9M68_987030 [compost metagenome]